MLICQYSYILLLLFMHSLFFPFFSQAAHRYEVPGLVERCVQAGSSAALKRAATLFSGTAKKAGEKPAA